MSLQKYDLPTREYYVKTLMAYMFCVISLLISGILVAMHTHVVYVSSVVSCTLSISLIAQKATLFHD